MSFIKTSSVLAAVFLGTFAGSARAQEQIDVKVPFSFSVHGREFPAGRYAVSNEHGAIEVLGIDKPSVIFTLTIPTTGFDPAGSEPALVFIHHENDYLLSQVWESSTEGFALLARPVASRRAQAQPVSPVFEDTIVVVAANGKATDSTRSAVRD
jgi:hypothetical protein